MVFVGARYIVPGEHAWHDPHDSAAVSPRRGTICRAPTKPEAKGAAEASMRAGRSMLRPYETGDELPTRRPASAPGTACHAPTKPTTGCKSGRRTSASACVGRKPTTDRPMAGGAAAKFERNFFGFAGFNLL